MLPLAAQHLFGHDLQYSHDSGAEMDYVPSWDKPLRPLPPDAPPIVRKPRSWGHTARKLALVALLVIQSAGVISFFGSVYISLHPFISSSADGDYAAMLGYLVIFVIATFFSVYIAIDSLLSKNTPQLIALCIFEGAMAAFGAILPHQIADAIRGKISPRLLRSTEWRLLVVPLIIGTCTIAISWLTYFFYKEFGWQTYKKLGGDIGLKKAMRTKSIFFMLQKFSFFFLVGVCVVVVQMRKERGGDLGLLDVALPASALVASCLVIVFATVAVELEIPFFVALYGIVWGGSMLFLCYEAIKLHPLSKATNSQHTMILFSSITILLLFATGVMAVVCCRNFGKGLKDAREGGCKWWPRIWSKRSDDQSMNRLGTSDESKDVRAILD